MNAVPQRIESAEAAPIASKADNMVPMLERVLMDPNVPIERLERLLDLHNAERQRQAKVDFARRMSTAQEEMRAVVVDKNNASTRSKYASYAALDAMARPIYARHGFSVTFNTEDTGREGTIRVVAFVENSGFERRYDIEMPCDGKGAKGGDVMTKTHAVKSAVTYGKSTLLPMIFNLAVTDRADDDGNGAGAPVESVTAEQVAELRKEMIEREIKEPAFCAFAGYALEDMPAADFAVALANVRRKPKKGA